jgi:hypothetical protein
MGIRMKSDKRREQLLQIMEEIYVKAKSPCEFTAELIAAKAEISAARVYQLIGTEYEELRSKLDGPRRSTKAEECKHCQENADLRRQINELRAQYEIDIQRDFAGAIRHIEALDGEVRTWRGRAEMYQQRLKKAGLFIEVPFDDMNASIKEESADSVNAAPVQDDNYDLPIETDSSDKVIHADEVYPN